MIDVELVSGGLEAEEVGVLVSTTVLESAEAGAVSTLPALSVATVWKR